MRGDIVKINDAEVRDKIYACWVGKNIGGTMGAPYENVNEILDVKGFETEKGRIIPNDDLDLQLVWLLALEEVGPYNLNARTLGEYWISYIPPHWSEYGICKSNLKRGIMPSASGELNNDKWKHSNGAWIRSEIWACTAPGFPSIAVKNAFMDATVDHGMGEGTIAAMFTAAMESLAFAMSDTKEIIKEALSYIPETSRVYKSVTTVINEYEKGTDWKEVRNLLAEMDKDIDHFMAPANVGYVILGLMYGEGDFKKSMIHAINCGDDTDCTAATVGAFLGLVNGTKGIPKDWAEHIGDEILTLSIEGGTVQNFIPKNLQELTDRVVRIMPVVLKSQRVDVDYVDTPSDYSAYENYESWCDVKTLLSDRSPYTEDDIKFVLGTCMIELNQKPEIAENGTLSGFLRMARNSPEVCPFEVRMILPEGWTAKYPKTFTTEPGYPTHYKEPDKYRKYFDFEIMAGEKVEPINKVILEISCSTRPTVIYIPIVILGK